MEPLADTVIEDARWDAAGLPAWAEAAVAATLAHLGLPAAGFQVVVLGCDDARMAALNAGFRGRPQPTNVLSWPAAELAGAPGSLPAAPRPGAGADPAGLGDIAIAFDTCAREAAGQGKPMADHVLHLLVHATLHLLGYDHQTEADARLMEAAEVRILDKLGVADPY